jgi:hypothetical protein
MTAGDKLVLGTDKIAALDARSWQDATYRRPIRRTSGRAAT